MSDERDNGSTIYQTDPIISKPSQFKAKGWCETVEGYLYEATKLAQCILRNQHNMRRSYEWSVTINLDTQLAPNAISASWTKTCRTLRRCGIVALWVREPNKANKIHYHLIIKNKISKKELENTIEDAMPPREIIPWRKCVEPIRDDWYYCHYIAKARIGKMDDRYADKRLLFKARLKLKKYGTIGAFWEPSKSKEERRLWEEIKAIEKTDRRWIVRAKRKKAGTVCP